MRRKADFELNRLNITDVTRHNLEQYRHNGITLACFSRNARAVRKKVWKKRNSGAGFSCEYGEVTLSSQESLRDLFELLRVERIASIDGRKLNCRIQG